MIRQRSIIFSMGAENYRGSNLETHDRYVNPVNSAWNREFGKLYKFFEEQNEEWQKLHGSR